MPDIHLNAPLAAGLVVMVVRGRVPGWVRVPGPEVLAMSTSKVLPLNAGAKPQAVRLGVAHGDVRADKREVVLTLRHPILVGEAFEAVMPFWLVKQMAGMIFTGEGKNEQQRLAAAANQGPMVIGVKR